MADLNDVLLALGKVQAGVDRLREDFTDEKNGAVASRKAIYDRHEALVREVLSLKVDIAENGSVVQQARDEVKWIGSAMSQHKAEMETSIEDWKRIKNLGLGIAGILAMGGLTVGATMSWAGETVVTFIRRWLKVE